MNMHSNPLSLRLVAVGFAALVFAACGSDQTTVASGGDDDVPAAAPGVEDSDVVAPDEDADPGAGVPDDSDPSVGAPDDSDPSVGAPDDDDPTSDPGGPMDVIASTNIGGEIVDPARHQIDDIQILESFPEQLAVVFTAGAEPCLAATASALADDTQILVTLDVGINTNAAATSCVAGLFEHTLVIALPEGIDGRTIVAAEAEERPVLEEPPVGGEFEPSLIGMTEEAARDVVESQGFEFRVVHIDGEDFAVTTDFNESRVNVHIVDGIVTQMSIG